MQNEQYLGTNAHLIPCTLNYKVKLNELNVCILVHVEYIELRGRFSKTDKSILMKIEILAESSGLRLKKPTYKVLGFSQN